MRLRKATHPALTLLLVAGLGVCVASAKAQGTVHKKSTASKPGSKSGSSLHRTRSSKKSSRRERGQKVPTPDRISEIQQALAKDGSFSGTPNGKWDDSTVEATRKFQEAHGLNATGKLDAKTLQKLGLGSQTTGVAPPLPPVSSSAATITPAPRVRPQQ
jgi:peptidoglycan hydrolase-like protein with peptidoglycan-binding domain